MTLTCLKCGQQAGLDVDMETASSIKCGDCDEEYTVDEAREMLAELNDSWGKVLTWLEQHPSKTLSGQSTTA